MWGKNWLSPRNIPWEFLLIKRAHGFKKNVQLQIITATTTQNAREIREIVGIFPHCISSTPAHLARANTTYLNANNENIVDFPPNHPT